MDRYSGGRGEAVTVQILGLYVCFVPGAAPRLMAMIALDTADCLRLRARGGTRVECVAGGVWITASGDVRDIFIRAGESRAVPSGVLVVEALEPSRVRVVREVRVRSPRVLATGLLPSAALGSRGAR